MNHRCFVRTRLRLPVMVYKQGRFIGRFETRDVDPEGAFIEMQMTDLEPNDIVELNFLVRGGERCGCRLFAGVVRLDFDGAGLILLDHENKTLDIIRRGLLRELSAVS